MTVRYNDLSVRWLGYACARLSVPDAPVVYTDPGRYGTLDGTWAEEYGGVPHPSGPAVEARDGDVVVITHDHHYDPDGVRRVASSDATLVVYESVDAERVAANRGIDAVSPEELPYAVERVTYGDELEVSGIRIRAVPAYNHSEGPNTTADGTPMHPQGFGCGFSIEVGGKRVFWTGDTDLIDEQRSLEVDVLLPTIAQSITMDRHDAAELAADVAPELVVPIHYNTFEGLRADSRAFAGEVAAAGIPVALDEIWD